MKPALLIIDLQKAWYRGDAADSMDAAARYANAALAAFRERDLPVAWVRHVDEEDGAVPGAPGFEFIDALERPAPGEPLVDKRYGNAFNKTGLGAYLAGEGVDTVVLAGFCAEYCVLSTCRGAEDLDLHPLLLRGALASRSDERIRFVEAVNETLSFGALERLLEATRP